MILQALISGIATGSVYSLIALGMVLIYKSSSVINFSQGALVMFGAFISYSLLAKVNLPMWFTIPLIIVCSSLVGVLIERLILRYMAGANLISVIMVTLGISFVLEGLATIIWGTLNYEFPQILPKYSITISGLYISEIYLWGFSISIIILVSFLFFFKYSKLGLMMRAVADNQKAAVSLGIDPNFIFLLSWAISSVVAAAGGIMLANLKLLNVGLSYIGLVVFPVIMLGGLDSILGAVVGGFIIAILESLSGVYIGSLLGGAVEQVVSFTVLLIILLVRPHGLFGTKDTVRL